VFNFKMKIFRYLSKQTITEKQRKLIKQLTNELIEN
jgi:hypothetical protein